MFIYYLMIVMALYSGYIIVWSLRNPDKTPPDDLKHLTFTSVDVAAAAEHALKAGLLTDDSLYSPFAAAADELGYTGDPTLEPSPFFTTLHGYRARFEAAAN